MLLVRRDKAKSLTPLVLHTSVVLGVVLYVVIGALVIRWLECKDHERDQNSGVAALNMTDTTPMSSSISSAERHTYPRRRRRSEQHRKPSLKRSRKCVIEAMKKINQITMCDPQVLNTLIVKDIDDCYLDDLKDLEKRRRNILLLHSTHATRQQHDVEQNKRQCQDKAQAQTQAEDHPMKWSFMDAVLFCFTAITTIGYGNVVPETRAGRIFVIAYCSLGIPFVMLAIANLGKFLAEFLELYPTVCFKYIKKCFKKLIGTKKSIKSDSSCLSSFERIQISYTDDEEDDSTEDVKEEHPCDHRFYLVLAFSLYILLGSVMVASYEGLDYFEATYFNFITLTTIGLGDIVPRSETYLFVTLLYISVGVALSTIGIEIAAEYLRKLHYFGRKIKDVSKVQIWFGGHRLTMKQLVKNLGDQFNLPESVVNDIDLDEFVDQAIKVESGEQESVRAAGKTRKISRRMNHSTYSSLKGHLTTIIREPNLGFDVDSLVFVDDEVALQNAQ